MQIMVPAGVRYGCLCCLRYGDGCNERRVPEVRDTEGNGNDEEGGAVVLVLASMVYDCVPLPVTV
ncbi:hypothetical protein [Streptomyces sp. NPDC002685]|uniref:hypothetical protein n=1 Tax=Streptomyces sp. NPDC002685 TaxID=3154540 RepID=UPI00332B91F7